MFDGYIGTRWHFLAGGGAGSKRRGSGAGLTRFYVSVRVRPYLTLLVPFLRRRHLVLHEGLLLVILIPASPVLPSLRGIRFDLILVLLASHTVLQLPVRPLGLAPQLLRRSGPLPTGTRLPDPVLVHSLQSPAHAAQQHHQPPLPQLRPVDQVRVDDVLQVAPGEVR